MSRRRRRRARARRQARLRRVAAPAGVSRTEWDAVMAVPDQSPARPRADGPAAPVASDVEALIAAEHQQFDDLPDWP